MERTAASTRDRLVSATRELMKRQGYHATGLNQIVDESQAPKGSLYHYFPGGKEELAVEALRQATAELAAQIQGAVNGSPDTKTALYLMGSYIAAKLKTSSFSEACPISTVALETAHQSPALQAACSEAFASMQNIIGRGLERDGYSAEESRNLATLMVCSYLGSLLLSRTHRNTEPIETTVKALGALLPQPGPRPTLLPESGPG